MLFPSLYLKKKRNFRSILIGSSPRGFSRSTKPSKKLLLLLYGREPPPVSLDILAHTVVFILLWRATISSRSCCSQGKRVSEMEMCRPIEQDPALYFSSSTHRCVFYLFHFEYCLNHHMCELSPHRPHSEWHPGLFFSFGGFLMSLQAIFHWRVPQRRRPICGLISTKFTVTPFYKFF